MDSQDVRSRVRNVFIRVFPDLKTAEFDFDTAQDSFPGWDSFTHMDLAAALEKEFSIRLTTAEIMSPDTASAWAALIEKKL